MLFLLSFGIHPGDPKKAIERNIILFLLSFGIHPEVLDSPIFPIPLLPIPKIHP